MKMKKISKKTAIFVVIEDGIDICSGISPRINRNTVSEVKLANILYLSEVYFLTRLLHELLAWPLAIRLIN